MRPGELTASPVTAWNQPNRNRCAGGRARAVSDRWPPQIKFIVGNEACEGSAIMECGHLAGYTHRRDCKGGLGRRGPTPRTSIIHTFVFANYSCRCSAHGFPTKSLAAITQFLGSRCFYCAGHGVLAAATWLALFTQIAPALHGPGLIAFGSGGISRAFRRSSATSSSLSNRTCSKKSLRRFYSVGQFRLLFLLPRDPGSKMPADTVGRFAVPGILMGLATFIFWLGTNITRACR